MKLSLVGRGIRPFEHLTLAGLRALREADVVLGIEPDVAAWSELAEEFELPCIERLDFLYRDGATDDENYKSFFMFIQDICGLYKHVALVIAGHPRLGVSIASWLSSPDVKKLITLEVIEGISSFDTMFNDLQIDPLERGTCLVDANRLLLFQYPLNTQIDTFIYHVSSVGNSRTDTLDCTQRNDIPQLQEYLLQFYSAEKFVSLCQASNFKNHSSQYKNIRLGELEAFSKSIDTGTTLFIPADKPLRLCPKFLSQLRSGHVSA